MIIPNKENEMSITTVDEIVMDSIEHIRRKQNGDNTPREKMSPEECEFRKLGAQIAEKAVREAFERVERNKHKDTPLATLIREFIKRENEKCRKTSSPDQSNFNTR